MASPMRLITAGAIGATIALGAAAGALWWAQSVGGSARTPLVGAASTGVETVEAGGDARSMPRELERLGAEPTDATAAEERSRALAARLAALEAKLARLSEQQSSLSRELQWQMRDSTPGWGAQNWQDETDGEMTPEERLEQAEAAGREQLDVIEETARAEHVDPEWAPAATLALHEAFSSEEMAGLELIEANCRTTLCRVDVWIDSSLTTEENQRRLMRASPWNGYVLFEISGDPPGATYYLAREGERLPAVAFE